MYVTFLKHILVSYLRMVNIPHPPEKNIMFFVSLRIFFRTTRVRIFIFFCRAKFFFQNSILGYMTKTLNQIIFFFLHQDRKFFISATLGIRIFFLEKNHNPPFKLNGRSLTLSQIILWMIPVFLLNVWIFNKQLHLFL